METNNTIASIIHHLECFAPKNLQESYDNCGLLTGQPDLVLKNILVTLDCTEEVVDEAIAKNCNLIVTHHPIIFSGLKKLNGNNYVERTIIKAIKNNIAIYAIHTNLDNVLHGVNAKIAEKLGLVNTRILLPKQGILKKIGMYVPFSHLKAVQDAAFKAGAGNQGNYSQCSFYSPGTGTFMPNEQANAFVGEPNKQHQEPEYKLELLVENQNLGAVIKAIKKAHPYEEVAYDIHAIENHSAQIGSGIVGEISTPLEPAEFLQQLKTAMQLNVIKYTPVNKPVKKIAICGGAGSFLLKHAILAGADALVTADFKYHEFFDAEDKLMIADIGHYESEFYTIQLLADEILKKFPTFAVILSEINTNPIKYYY